MRPSSGSITKIPLARNTATLETVAAFSHISGCIAGTKTNGLVLALIVLVSKSSQIPLAIFAIKSAVAGATTIKFASRAAFICGTSCTLFQRFEFTERPESASQVEAPTKLRLALVGITVIANPISCNRRKRSADL